MNVDDWRAAYVAGLVDNHAGLVVTVGKASNRRVGYRIAVECRIKLQSEESTELLTAFCEDHDIAYRARTDDETTYENYEIIISRRGAVQAFLEQIHSYLVARADAVDRLCNEIIPRLEAGDHCTKESFVDLMTEIETFREEVGRANRAKYDRQHFLDEWDLDSTAPQNAQ